jgi:hypothetical protein
VEAAFLIVSSLLLVGVVVALLRFVNQRDDDGGSGA